MFHPQKVRKNELPQGLPLSTLGALLAAGLCLASSLFVWLVHGASLALLAWTILPSLIGAALGWLLGKRFGNKLIQLQQSMQAFDKGETPQWESNMPLECVAVFGEWQRARERMEQLIGAQKDFSANAAHELKTPLAALRLAAENAASQTNTSAQAQESMQAIMEEADRVTSVVDRLLLLARAESGRIPVKADYSYAGNLLREVCELLQPLAKEKQQTLVVEEEDNWSVWADVGLLRLALENLLVNAIHHTPASTQIVVKLQRLPEGGVAFDVIDEGPGVKSGDEERVFERFYRGTQSSNSGSGLGLPLARWAVGAFGASLQLLPVAGKKGCCFRIRCPETEWDYFADIASASSESPLDPPSLDWLRQTETSQVIARLKSRANGLSPQEAEERLEAYGPNRITHPILDSLGQLIWRACRTPFNGILSVCIALSLLLGEWQPAIIMTIMVSLSSVLRFWQEWRARTLAESLEDAVEVHSQVARGKAGEPTRLPVEDLVPGDIVHLSAGDMVPADIRLLTANGLQVSEATLTGESYPLAKTSACIIDDSEAHNQASHAENCCFMGTHVVAGSGIGVVYATGTRTVLGSGMARMRKRPPDTHFDLGVRKVSLQLLSFMAVLVPLVFLVNGLLKGGWTESLLFALAVAVGLTPEMLPVIVNLSLAKSARGLSRLGLIIKDLASVQGLGAMQVLCIDKTGTLTENHPQFQKALGVTGLDCDWVLDRACLNARFKTSRSGALDQALLKIAGERGLASIKEKTHWRCVGEIPFDFERRRVSVVLKQESASQGELICKGAPEAVIAACSHFADTNRDASDLTTAKREQTMAVAESLLQRGWRVLAIAQKSIPFSGKGYHVSDETALCLLGFVAFADPLKADVRNVIQSLADDHVAVKILTGDHAFPALSAAQAAGVDVSAGVIDGIALEGMDSNEFAEAVGRYNVFARLSPLDKSRIVRVLRETGQTVGYMGEGANDALALRQADIGLAADGGAPLARDSADAIIASKDLQVLLQAIREGRTAFGNCVKYIRITASSNFGNAFSVLLASIWLPFLPMRAVQLLAQNLLYDLAQLFLPWDKVDQKFTAKPCNWQDLRLSRYMWVYGPVSSLFDVMTFAMLWYGFSVSQTGDAAFFQSGWFVLGLSTQLVIVHILRTHQRPLFRNLAATPLLTATLVVGCIGIALPFLPIASWFGFVPLPGIYLLWVVLMILLYASTVQWLKRRVG